MGKEPGNYTLEIHQKRSVSKMPFHSAARPCTAFLALHSLQCVIARALRARGKAGRCGHRPLRNPIGKSSVGADAYIVPPLPAIKLSARRCCTAPLVKGVIARPVRKLVVAIRTPRPIRRGRRLRRPAPQGFLLPSVGADASVRPSRPCTALHAKTCHCEASANTGRGNPHPPSLGPLA